MSHLIDRRIFLKQGSAAAVAFALSPAFGKKPAPSDKVRVAHIGLGGMGLNHLRWFAALPEVEIAALCDLDEDHLNTAIKTLDTLKPGQKATAYSDFRKLLERKDIDAITCATPDHWHAQIATLAFRAGKDVYGEKPLSFDVWEGQRMLKALNRNNCVFQLGTQIHAGENYHRVAELIQAGTIGKVHTVRLWKSGLPPDLGPAQVQPPPKTLNWDMWLGPAPYTDYTPQRCHRTFRYFLDYSGGIFQDFWCHIADIVYWSVSPKGLKTITARGEAPDGIADAPKWMDADFEFDNLKLFWTHEPPDVPGAAKRGIGAYFEGNKGTLICDYSTREITINGVTVNDIPEVPKTIIRSPGHQQDFINSVKSRTQPASNLEYVREMTLPMHLALIAYRLNRKLTWNSRREKFVNDREANEYLFREYRKNWDLV